jgi:hypothetical protein
MRQAVTRRLRILTDAGLVQDVKLGRERLWQLEPEAMEEARRSVEVIGRRSKQALGRLKASPEAQCVRRRDGAA